MIAATTRPPSECPIATTVGTVNARDDRRHNVRGDRVRSSAKVMTWLRERATTDTAKDVRQAAIRALAGGWGDDPTTVTWLRERATTDTDEDVRQAALDAPISGRRAP